MTGSEESREPNLLLKKARMERMWTQRHVAFELSVEIKTVASWENGKRFPSLEMRPKICQLYGKSPEELGLLKVAEQEEVSQSSVKQEELKQLVAVSATTAAPLPVAESQTEKEETEEHQDTLPRIEKIEISPIKVSSHRDMNRQRMLRRVHSLWIAGIFERSLYQHNLLVLPLQDQPDALQNPWQDTVQESMLSAKALPDGTRIIQLYDEADGELLLLGEPGAGKTTTLLELTQTLLERARKDEQHPLPVVFNLSGWSEQQPLLHDWLAQELHTKYQVPLALAQTWIKNEQILVLLDGLDEVAPERRTACIEAINAYRTMYGLVPVVVCSRIADYLAQPTRLLLNRAVVLRALTKQQADEYIRQAGTDLAALQQALQRDPALQDMAATPLMLNTLIVAYQGASSQAALIEGDTAMRRHYVFDKFVERVLERRGPRKIYTRDQLSHYLGWLAQRMQQHNQTEFYVERLQPDWLEENRRKFRKTIIRIVLGLSILVDSGIYACFRGDSVPNQLGLFYWLGGNGLGNSILGWMQPGIASLSGLKGAGMLGLLTFLLDLLIVFMVRQKALPTFSFAFFRSGIKNGIRHGLIVGILFAFLYTIPYGAFHGVAGIFQGLLSGFWAAALVGMMITFKDALQYGKNAQSFDEKTLVFRRTPTERLADFGIYMCCGVLGLGSIYALESGAVNSLVIALALIDGIGMGIIFGLSNIANSRSGIRIQPAETVSWSWQQVKETLGDISLKGLRLGCTLAIYMGIALGCLSGLSYGAAYGLRYGLTLGVITGIIMGVASILTGILNEGWKSTMVSDPEHEFAKPNQGIRNSWRNAFFAACLFGPIGGVVSGLISGFLFRLTTVPGWFTLLLGFVLIYSIVFAFRLWLTYGGIACFEHYVLRWSLWRNGSIPWNYIRFLDFAAERTLLRKVGGGYIFSHRLLLEYFADLAHTNSHAH